MTNPVTQHTYIENQLSLLKWIEMPLTGFPHVLENLENDWPIFQAWKMSKMSWKSLTCPGFFFFLPLVFSAWWVNAIYVPCDCLAACLGSNPTFGPRSNVIGFHQQNLNSINGIENSPSPQTVLRHRLSSLKTTFISGHLHLMPLSLQPRGSSKKSHNTVLPFKSL